MQENRQKSKEILRLILSEKNPSKIGINPKTTPILKNFTTLSYPPGDHINKKTTNKNKISKLHLFWQRI